MRRARAFVAIGLASIAPSACGRTGGGVPSSLTAPEIELTPIAISLADTVRALEPSVIVARFRQHGPPCTTVGAALYSGSGRATFSWLSVAPHTPCAEHRLSWTPAPTWRSPDLPVGIGRTLALVCAGGSVRFEKRLVVQMDALSGQQPGVDLFSADSIAAMEATWRRTACHR